MAEYIEREALLKHLREVYDDMHGLNTHFYQGFMNAVYHVKEFHAADVAPVVHEKWEWREEWETHPGTHSCDLIGCGWYCTGCGIELGDYLSKKTGQYIILDDDFAKPKLAYCPNCGAHMKDGD